MNKCADSADELTVLHFCCKSVDEFGLVRLTMSVFSTYILARE